MFLPLTHKYVSILVAPVLTISDLDAISTRSSDASPPKTAGRRGRRRRMF